ncbi:MAG: ankyrin repeat domain-containing protein [Fimbriimonadales bacterium]
MLRSLALVTAVLAASLCPAQTKKQEDAIWAAMQKRDEAALAKLIQGRDINKPTSTGDTLLVWGCRARTSDRIIAMLLDARADPNKADTKFGLTPLMVTAQSFWVATARLLIKRGAKPGLRDKQGLTAMHYCVNWTQYDVGYGGQEESEAEVIQILIDAGADPNAADAKGMTPMMWAAGWMHPPSLETLIRNHANLEVRDKRGRTAMTWAAGHGRNAAETQVLIKAGAKIHIIDALEFGEPALARQLLAAGDDPSGRGPYGETALMISAQDGDLELVKALIARGADLSARDDIGASALHLAIGSRPHAGQIGLYWDEVRPSTERPEIIRALIHAGAKMDAVTDKQMESDHLTPLMWAVQGSTPEVVKALLQSADNPNRQTKGEYGAVQTALSELAHSGSLRDQPHKLENALILLHAGADPRLLGGQSPLNEVLHAFSESTEVLKILLSKGLSVNRPDQDSLTPLMIVVGNPESVRLLLSRGARVNAADGGKWTPLMYAATRGSLESVKLLLAEGADRRARNKDGQTAEALARSDHKHDIADMIANWKR